MCSGFRSKWRFMFTNRKIRLEIDTFLEQLIHPKVLIIFYVFFFASKTTWTMLYLFPFRKTRVFTSFHTFCHCTLILVILSLFSIIYPFNFFIELFAKIRNFKTRFIGYARNVVSSHQFLCLPMCKPLIIIIKP